MVCEQVPLMEFLRGELETTETAAVLEHVQSCQDCRQRLQTMAAIEATLREARGARKNQTKLWLIAAGILAGALAFVFYAVTPPPDGQVSDLSRLGTQEPYPYFPLQTRSEVDRSEAEMKGQAFSAYSQREFKEAVEVLSRLPATPETFFYRGVSYYFLKQYPLAITDLKRASELDRRWRAPALWYEASIHLNTNQKQRAEQALQELIEQSSDDYRQKATQLLEQLRRLE